MDTDVDAVRESLLEQLQQVKEVRDLQEMCNGLGVVIPLAKQGKLSAVRSLLLRHLTSAEMEGKDDEGLAVFQDVLQQVQTKLAATGVVPKTDQVGTEDQNQGGGSVAIDGGDTGSKAKTEMKVDTSKGRTTAEQGGANAAEQRNMVMVEHIRVNKEFKLGGTVGDGKNCLGYGTIYYRMLEGKNNGFKPKEIMAGVVRAMQAGSELGQWFETHPELEWDEFLEILRNHYQLENYGRMLMNLGKEFQKPSEEAIDFTYRMTRLRDDILAVAAHENAVVEKRMVQEQCLHGLQVGLRSNTIRLELRSVLADKNIKDPVLFKEVKAAEKREKEYLEMQQEQQEAQVKANSANKKKNGSASVAAAAVITEDKTNLAILEQLQKLTTSNEQLAAQMKKRESEMSEMKNDLEQFKKRLASGGNAGGGGFRNRGPLKCPVCQTTGAYCKHCAHCGKDDHKIKDCPEKNG